MKNLIKKCSLLALVVSLMIAGFSTATLAGKPGKTPNANLGDTSYSSKGSYVSYDQKTGNITTSHGVNLPINGNNQVEVPFNHTVIVPPGTTKIDIHFGKDADGKFKGNSDPTSNDNGHSNLKNPGDIGKLTDGTRADFLGKPNVQGPKTNEKGETYFSIDGTVGIG